MSYSLPCHFLNYISFYTNSITGLLIIGATRFYHFFIIKRVEAKKVLKQILKQGRKCPWIHSKRWKKIDKKRGREIEKEGKKHDTLLIT